MSALRSLLFAPGNHARRVEKALGLPPTASSWIWKMRLPSAEKAATRPWSSPSVRASPRIGKLYVRVNALTTEWCYARSWSPWCEPDWTGSFCRKWRMPHQLRTADWVIGALEQERGLPPARIDLVPIIETALGISNLRAICRSGTRTKRLAFGAGDFTLDLGDGLVA